MKHKVYTHAITRKPSPSMAEGITTQKEPVNFAEACTQHEIYVKSLEKLGLKVTVLDPLADYPDSHFVEDTAIIHNKVAITTRPGALARRGEVKHMTSTLRNLLPICELGGDEATLVDGGDVIFMGSRALIGISNRTNLAGANRLKSILNEIDPTLEIHFLYFEGVLHLKTGLTALGDTFLLGNPQIKLRQKIDFAQIIWLPENEGYAANTLTINGTTFHCKESKSAQAAIKSAGNQTLALHLSEFKKMDGFFTCLSLLW